MIKNYQLAPTNSEINKMLGLSDKDFKAAMIKTLQQATKIFLKWTEKYNNRNKNLSGWAQ